MNSVETVEVHLDQDFLNLLREGPRELDDVVREYLVTEAYRRREISSGKAAELLNMSRVAFLEYAGRLGILYIDMTEEEMREEIRSALAA